MTSIENTDNINQEHAVAIFTNLRTQFQKQKYLDVTITTSKDNNE